MSKKTRIKVLAVFMVLVIGFLVPGNHFAGQEVGAATAKKTYIKEFKIFIAEIYEKDAAKKWCDNQPENQDDDKDNDWAVINNNLNAGAKGG